MTFRCIPMILVIVSANLLGGCAGKPLNPWTADSPPLALVPVADAGIDDRRGRFREIFCAVLESRGEEWPDYRPCDEALTRVADEPPGTGQPVDLGQSHRKLLALIVPGVGWECIEGWLGVDESVENLMSAFGFEAQLMKVDGLSSSANNARQIRDGIVALPEKYADYQIALIGYSKGAPDILQALVEYPEITERIAYYSLVTYPQPDRISSVLNVTYKKLAMVDGRNDGQVIYHDQVIPGGILLGFVNADHWALAVPIARSHSFIGATFVDQNDFPREALIEAVLRFVEEDMQQRKRIDP